MSKEIDNLIDRIVVQLCPELTKEFLTLIGNYELQLDKLSEYEKILNTDRLTSKDIDVSKIDYNKEYFEKMYIKLKALENAFEKNK